MCNVTSTNVSPEEGFEPTTNGLTVRCSTAELFRNKEVLILEKVEIFHKRFMAFFWSFSNSLWKSTKRINSTEAAKLSLWNF